MTFDQKFWLRVASRCDTATDDEKERLTSLSRQTMTLVEQMVKQTESQLNDSGTVLQDVMKAGADKDGVWHVPLSEDRVEAMRQVPVSAHSTRPACVMCNGAAQDVRLRSCRRALMLLPACTAIADSAHGEH